MTQALIELSDLSFRWPGHPVLLDIPAFRLQAGETLFLKGPSGSGKTTLLGLLGGVQKANSGSIRFSVGAAHVRTGNFIYFDNKEHTIGPEHIMASGALPPACQSPKSVPSARHSRSVTVPVLS